MKTEKYGIAWDDGEYEDSESLDAARRTASVNLGATVVRCVETVVRTPWVVVES